MAPTSARTSAAARKRKLGEAMEILKSLGFGPRQSNEVAAYTFLALLDLAANASWSAASNPLRGITPIIEFISNAYGVRYAPNTRETIRDEAVKYFVETGLLLRNPDNPSRPTNSGKTVYQAEPTALALVRTFGTKAWPAQLREYLGNRAKIRQAVERERNLARIPVKLLSGATVTLSPGGQNPLIKQIIEEFCPRFAPGATVAYIGDAESKFLHLEAAYLEGLGVVIAPSVRPASSLPGWVGLFRVQRVDRFGARCAESPTQRPRAGERETRRWQHPQPSLPPRSRYRTPSWRAPACCHMARPG